MSWESDWHDAEVTVWSRYDDYLTVTGLTRDGMDRLEHNIKNIESFWEELVNDLREKHSEEDDYDEEDDEEELEESKSFVNLLSIKLNEEKDSNSLSKICAILEKYGNDESDVAHNFIKATKEDKAELMRLVK